MQEAQSGLLRDTMVASAQLKVEHNEVASYRGLLTAARQMRQNEVTGMLLQNLQQEEQTALLVEQSTPMLLQKAM